MRMQYRLTDPACAEDLVIALDMDEEDDPDGFNPWATEDTIDEVCNWWTDPRGRGYLTLGDGFGVVLVDASSGEPTIETWSDIDDERYELGLFPFPSLDYTLEGTDK